MSVVAQTAAEADAWATALMVLDPEAGRGLAEAEGLAAYWIERDAEGAYRTFASSTFPPIEGPPAR